MRDEVLLAAAGKRHLRRHHGDGGDVGIQRQTGHVDDGVGHMPMEEVPMESALDADRFIQTGSVEKRDETPP